MTDLPVLYSFRRCPYAIRARLALLSSGVRVELREILLRNKPDAFLAASPSATVPCLDLRDGSVVDESFDIMLWALDQSDPEAWLRPRSGDRTAMIDLVGEIDGAFKHHLDRYKYAPREQLELCERHRSAALRELTGLEGRLNQREYLFGDTPALADWAIAPFVRQFANVDIDWFDANAGEPTKRWLASLIGSDFFHQVMEKRPVWQPGRVGEPFPALAA